MHNKAYLLIGAVVLLLTSCSDELTVYQDEFTDTIMVENDELTLQQNVSLTSAGVVDILASGTTIPLASKMDDDEDGENEPAGNYPLTQVARILPPVFEGNLLTSTHVYVESDYAYVSYNTVGETYLGAVDIIQISNPRNPRLKSRLFYRNADINSLVYDDGYLYIVGGVDATASPTATDHSFIGKIRIKSGKFYNTKYITYAFQGGQNATDVVLNGSQVIVTSGASGVLAVYDKETLEKLSEAPFDDLRSLAKSDSRYAVLDAGKGISILNQELQPTLEIPISTELGIASKKTIDFHNNKIVVPEAGRGAGIYDATSGILLEYIAIPTNPVLENPQDKTTNAVGLNEDALLMANGGAGICLSEELPTGAFGLVGILELDGSMNFLATKDDYIIAASGTAGVQIIKFNRPSPSLVSRCMDLPEYEGSSKLIVRTDDVLAYSGSKRFNNINISGALLLCGSWTVRNSVIIRDRALFEMNGMMTVGKNNRRRDLKVEKEATLKIEGELTIYGDLKLEDGATLEFIGNDNIINVFGDVEIGDDVDIYGSFEDVQGKF